MPWISLDDGAWDLTE